MSDADEEQQRRLLKTYEPVLRFARGERFFPVRVEDYLAECRLFRQRPLFDGDVTRLWDQQIRIGKRRAETLGEFKRSGYYLEFAQPEFGVGCLWAYVVALAGVAVLGWTKFGAGVGLWFLGVGAGLFVLARLLRSQAGITVVAGAIASLVCGFLSWSVSRPILQEWALLCAVPIIWIAIPLFLGKVPGFFMDLFSHASDSAAKGAVKKYNDLLARTKSYTCYGRVAKDGEWMALQYSYFYPFNDWRLSAGGMNHHEGDWETVVVFLKQGRGEPYGVAYSAHHEGHFQRWKYVRKVCSSSGEATTHPLVYVALGSHANYRRPCQIKSADLFKPGLLQKIVYAIDSYIRNFQKGRQRRLANVETERAVSKVSRFFGLPERNLSSSQVERDVNLPTEIATGDGTRIGVAGAPDCEKTRACGLPPERLQDAPPPAMAEWTLEAIRFG